ncbi:hypothetical protein [Streptomyces sp. NPDC048473]|uniref:hypothetical protein n=1 Tax=unclassified Streptomyces TaxID=2593676 RepID=UPI00371C7D30
MIVHCLYSRHSDGLVRQRHLEQILESSEPWVVPFVVQLAGEYVLEILEAIGQGLPGLAVPGSDQRRLYGEFIARNPAFFVRTERRVVSYWSCYYRWKYGPFGTYPGCALLDAFRAAASELAGTQWPRHTPPSLAVSDFRSPLHTAPALRSYRRGVTSELVPSGQVTAQRESKAEVAQHPGDQEARNSQAHQGQ